MSASPSATRSFHSLCNILISGPSSNSSRRIISSLVQPLHGHSLTTLMFSSPVAVCVIYQRAWFTWGMWNNDAVSVRFISFCLRTPHQFSFSFCLYWEQFNAHLCWYPELLPGNQWRSELAAFHDTSKGFCYDNGVRLFLAKRVDLLKWWKSAETPQC